MLELQNDRLVFRFPEVHPDATLTITLVRTLRIPDDGKAYPLPPGLGAFPVRHVDDFAAKVPQKWLGRGGVMVPLYQSEALWLQFQPQHSHGHGHCYPFAVKVATGKCSAITGKKWSKKLREKDYLVCPEQPWLDGYVVEDGTVRQFVAAPLGLGVTAEEQITGKAEFGGLQIEVIPMALESFLRRYPKLPPQPHHLGGMLRSRGLMSTQKHMSPSAKSAGPGSYGGHMGPVSHGLPGVYTNVATEEKTSADVTYACNSINVLSDAEARAKRPELYGPQASMSAAGVMDSLELDCLRSDSDDDVGAQLDMGLAPGGKMKQQVFDDPYGLSEWHPTEKSRCFVHMANSLGWEHVTGQKPPTTPMTSATYTNHGYPWFEFYAEGFKSHTGTDKTKGLKSMAELAKEKKLPLLPENQSVEPKHTVILQKPKSQVRDGVWK